MISFRVTGWSNVRPWLHSTTWETRLASDESTVTAHANARMVIASSWNWGPTSLYTNYRCNQKLGSGRCPATASISVHYRRQLDSAGAPIESDGSIESMCLALGLVYEEFMARPSDEKRVVVESSSYIDYTITFRCSSEFKRLLQSQPKPVKKHGAFVGDWFALPNLGHIHPYEYYGRASYPDGSARLIEAGLAELKTVKLVTKESLKLKAQTLMREHPAVFSGYTQNIDTEHFDKASLASLTAKVSSVHKTLTGKLPARAPLAELIKSQNWLELDKIPPLADDASAPWDTPIIYDTTLNDGRRFVMISAKRLAWILMQWAVLLVDGTFKLLHNGHIVIRIVVQFQGSEALEVATIESESDSANAYAVSIVMLQRLVYHLFAIKYSPKFVVADGETGLSSLLRKVVSDETRRLSCTVHVFRNVDAQLTSFNLPLPSDRLIEGERSIRAERRHIADQVRYLFQFANRMLTLDHSRQFLDFGLEQIKEYYRKKFPAEGEHAAWYGERLQNLSVLLDKCLQRMQMDSLMAPATSSMRPSTRLVSGLSCIEIPSRVISGFNNFYTT